MNIYIYIYIYYVGSRNHPQGPWGGSIIHVCFGVVSNAPYSWSRSDRTTSIAMERPILFYFLLFFNGLASQPQGP
jgi:hypothetical protein